MKQKIISFITALTMIISLAGGFTVITSAAESPTESPAESPTGLSGSGTEENPYLIPDLAALETFRDYINSSEGMGENQYFKMTADIDMSGKYSEIIGRSWTPIGSEVPLNTHQVKKFNSRVLLTAADTQ